MTTSNTCLLLQLAAPKFVRLSAHVRLNLNGFSTRFGINPSWPTFRLRHISTSFGSEKKLPCLTSSTHAKDSENTAGVAISIYNTNGGIFQ